MAAFVVSSETRRLWTDDCRLALSPHEDLVLGILKVLHAHPLGPVQGGLQRGLVHQIEELRSRHAGSPASKRIQVQVLRRSHSLSVQLKNLSSAFDVWKRHSHMSVKPAGAKERIVENICVIRRPNHDDSLVLLESIHLHEQLVQSHLHGLLLLELPGAPHGIDFVDEDDARRPFLGRFEHVSHPPRSYADVHLLELRTRRVEKGHPCFSRDGPGKQRLARAGRAHEQDATRHLPTQASEFCGVLEVHDDLLKLRFGLIHTHDIIEPLVRRLRAVDLMCATHARRHSPGSLVHEGADHGHHEECHNSPPCRGPEAAVGHALPPLHDLDMQRRPC
mmetsp:Transcript_29700/g.86530  ORF Transcript_29700/g.86530 Transcript_29700/m.86530 type:complete len:334 (-) Transcript_29700:476-1477(-)